MKALRPWMLLIPLAIAMWLDHYHNNIALKLIQLVATLLFWAGLLMDDIIFRAD